MGQRAGDNEIAKTLLDLITPRTPPELAVGLLRAVQTSEAPATGSLVLERLPLDQQIAVVRHHLQGTPLAIVAKEMGRSKAAVAGLLHERKRPAMCVVLERGKVECTIEKRSIV